MLLVATLVGIAARADGFQRPERRGATILRGKTRGVDPLDELETYWEQHGAKWKRTLEILDVRAAWQAGECDGVLPSGKRSRAAAQEKLVDVARALELYDSDELQIRRRFRNATPSELLPRWTKILEERDRLQDEGAWDAAVVQSEQQREFQQSIVKGEVESADASPALSRAVATALSPVLKAAANTRNKADGGQLLELNKLQETAGADAAERWLTAALLASLETEVASLEPRAAAPQSFREREDELEAGEGLGLFGGGVGGTRAAADAPALGASAVAPRRLWVLQRRDVVRPALTAAARARRRRAGQPRRIPPLARLGLGGHLRRHARLLGPHLFVSRPPPGPRPG